MNTQIINGKTSDGKGVLRSLVLLVFGLFTAFALSAPARAGLICDGAACIWVDDFSYANQFQPTGNPDHLYDLMHFVSINNGPVQAVDAANYIVIAGLPDWNPGCSTVVRNPFDLQIDFCHTVVDGGPTAMYWFLDIYLTNLLYLPLDVCHYLYADLDLFETAADDRALYTPAHPITLGPTFQVTDARLPDSVFLVGDLTGGSSNFELNPYPTVRANLSAAQNCIGLPNVQPNMFGDFTGALQYTMTLNPGDTALIQFLIVRLN